ncbi:MAG TPA: hypothetical protein VK772_04445 [Puia sp.]|jgi:hypothetical protein|nr:hypothetical protein [Puia sp.]
MIIGLLALTYLLFGGGHQTFLLNPELKKNVSTYVVNSKRKDDIYLLIKQAEKSEAVFLKETKNVFDKKLVSLNMDTLSTTADFMQEYNKFYDSLAVLQNKYVGDEIKIRSFILPNEWDSIMKKVLILPDQAKARKSLMEENQKLSGNLQAACNKYISDPSSKKQSVVYVDGYKAKGDSVAIAFLDMNYKYISVIRPYNVSRSDFEPIRSRMIYLRRDYSNYLVDMRFKLKAITPNKNWHDLAKVLNNNFVYLGAGISK